MVVIYCALKILILTFIKSLAHSCDLLCTQVPIFYWVTRSHTVDSILGIFPVSLPGFLPGFAQMTFFVEQVDPAYICKQPLPALLRKPSVVSRNLVSTAA